MLSGKFAWSAEVHKIERVGIEAYTIRDLLKQDFNGTPAKIAAIGYKEVELGSTQIDNSKEAAHSRVAKTMINSFCLSI